MRFFSVTKPQQAARVCRPKTPETTGGAHLFLLKIDETTGGSRPFLIKICETTGEFHSFL